MCASLCNKAVMFLIESRQNLWKDRWEVASVARRCTTWRGKPYSRRAIENPVHHTSVSVYAQSRGDQITIQRVGFLSPLFWALFHCAGGWWSQYMLGRGLERGAGCLPNLDPRQKVPSWCMRGTSTSHIPPYDKLILEHCTPKLQQPEAERLRGLSWHTSINIWIYIYKQTGQGITGRRRAWLLVYL